MLEARKKKNSEYVDNKKNEDEYTKENIVKP